MTADSSLDRSDKIPTVAVVMINYRSIRDIERRLGSEALRGQHVVIVDNASDPERVSQLGEREGIDALLSPTNGGFAAGVNLALAHLDRQGCDLPRLLLNPDVALSASALRALVATQVESQSDAVSPLLIEPSGRLQVGVAGMRLSLASVCIYFLFVAHLFPAARGIFLTRRQSRRGGSVAWLCGGCLLLSSDSYRKFGEWPEDEIVYAEDVAWGTKATAQGASFLLASDIIVEHAVGGSGSSAAWSGALRRLCKRRLGLIGGPSSSGAIILGITLRRLMGRIVP